MSCARMLRIGDITIDRKRWRSIQGALIEEDVVIERIHIERCSHGSVKSYERRRRNTMKKITQMCGFMCFVFCCLFSSYVYADMPEADPGELWNYITKVSPYKEWRQWLDHQGIQPGRAPHGPLHKVYVNENAFNSPKPPVQYGAIVVKENYSKTEELKAITVMYKVIDYNPKDGDWFWVKYTPQGKAKPFGKPAGCIGCHGTRAHNDFILVHEF